MCKTTQSRPKKHRTAGNRKREQPKKETAPKTRTERKINPGQQQQEVHAPTPIFHDPDEEEWNKDHERRIQKMTEREKKLRTIYTPRR